MANAAVFVNPSGQRANLGDSVLRRGLLSAVQPVSDAQILLGGSPFFESALGVSDAATTYNSRSAWLRAAATRRDGVFLLNAGELVSSDRRNVAWQTVLATARRLAGGRVMASGIGLRQPARYRSAKMLLDQVDVLEWRDPDSRDAYGRGSVIPDWAFSLGSADQAPTAQRDRIAVSMRGDRPPVSEAALAAIRRYAESEGLEIIVVTQVTTDARRSGELADALGARTVAWHPDSDHQTQEAIVRAEYARSRAVVSDRIHSLIIGLTEGATPIGLCTASTEKVRRTFAAVTTERVAHRDDAAGFSEFETALATAGARGETWTQILESARARLRDSALISALGAGRRP